MQKIITLAIIISLGFVGNKAYTNYLQQHRKSTIESDEPSETDSAYKCDGRVYCSQMSSCEEAEFFLRNCPDVKMDGDNDGVPCEKQWCNK